MGGVRGQPCWVQGVESCPWNHTPLLATVSKHQVEEQVSRVRLPWETRQHHILPVSMVMGSGCVVGWAGEEGCAWALQLPLRSGQRESETEE